MKQHVALMHLYYWSCMHTCIIRLILHSIIIFSTGTEASPFRKYQSAFETNWHHKSKRAAINDEDRLWPNAVIPYRFDGRLKDEYRELLIQAIQHWENKTCIQFVEKASEHLNYVQFTTEDCGCCSSVGMIGGKQTLSLSAECATAAVAIHEIGHVVGFFHEHTRPDRDKYVKVLWNNISKDKHVNFDTRLTIEINSRGRPYDKHSVMHYGPRTFTNGQGDTLKLLDGSTLAHPLGLSEEDILQTQLMYNCPQPKCHHVIETIGQGVLTTPYYPNNYLPDTDCTWQISLANGYHVHLSFETFDIQDGYHCSADYVEIRSMNSTGEVIGYFCGPGIPPPIKSSKPLWIKFHSNWIIETAGFLAHYRIEDVQTMEKMDLALNGMESRYIKPAQAINTNCVEVAASNKHGTYSSLDIPNGDLADPVLCSLLIQADLELIESFISIHLELRSNSKRVYGSNCLGDIYTLNSGTASEQGAYLSEFESSGDSEVLAEEKWKFQEYYCSGPDQLISLSLKSMVTFIRWNSLQHSHVAVEYWIDYDECQSGQNACQQVCENTVKGYQCACYPGYKLIGGNDCAIKSRNLEDQCQQELTETTGIIRSSTEPFSFCTYNIILPDHKIVLILSKLLLPISGNCSLNYIRIKSGKRILTTICTDIVDSEFEIDAGRSMTIEQFVDLQQISTLPFFKAEYMSFLKTPDRCVHDLYAMGRISSPGFPNQYPSSMRCLWKLWAMDGHIILLNLTSVEIEGTEGCQFDRLDVFDGRRRDPNKLLKRVCGSPTSLVIQSAERAMVLEFWADESGSGRGFHGNFISVLPNT